jgi:hypothetical protein
MSSSLVMAGAVEREAPRSRVLRHRLGRARAAWEAHRAAKAALRHRALRRLLPPRQRRLREVLPLRRRLRRLRHPLRRLPRLRRPLRRRLHHHRHHHRHHLRRRLRRPPPRRLHRLRRLPARAAGRLWDVWSKSIHSTHAHLVLRRVV